MSASTHTRRAAMPSRQNVLTRARLMASERVLEMVEADELVAVIEDDPDRVAADPGEVGTLARLVEPRAGQAADLAALALVQALPRSPLAEPAGLHLGEHERVA